MLRNDPKFRASIFLLDELDEILKLPLSNYRKSDDLDKFNKRLIKYRIMTEFANMTRFSTHLNCLRGAYSNTIFFNTTIKEIFTKNSNLENEKTASSRCASSFPEISNKT